MSDPTVQPVAAAPDLTPLFITRYLAGKSLCTALVLVVVANVPAAVGVTALVYYAVLTFPKEVEYIWKGKRWDATNICFMWNRYSSLAGLIYGAYCTYRFFARVLIRLTSFCSDQWSSPWLL